MKLTLKNVFLSVGMFVFAFGFFAVSNVNAADTLSSSTYRDVNLDGTVETIVLVFDENVTACTYDAADWAVTVAGSIGVTAVTGISCTGGDANLTLNVTTTPKVTGGATAPTITYTNAGTAGSVTLTSGVMTAKSASPTDLAKPQIKTFTYLDANTNGFMDTIEVAYTEAVQGASVLGANDLTFTSVGGFTNAAFGALATDLIIVDGVTSTTVPLGTPTTVSGTVNPSGTIAISTKTLFSLLDTAGNNNTTLGAQSGNATIVDGIKPTVVSTTPVDNSTSQSKTNPIVVVFSEAMDTDSLTFYMTPINVPHTAAWTVGDTTLTLSHLSYTKNTEYVATFTALDDAAGNSLAVGPTLYSWNFTTTTVGGSDSSSSPVTITYSSSSNNNETTTTVEITTTTTSETTVVPGCSGGNAYNTQTGAVCVNNATTTIAGCGNRNTGFSTSSGVSCAGNKVSSTVTTTTTTTTTTKYNLGNTTLKNGSKGEAVKELQRFLNAKLNLGLVVDGSLGPKTIAVIKKWQMDNGLVADGLVGAKTKAMMNK